MSVQAYASTAQTQQAPTFNDAVDASRSSVLTICGGLTYSIEDVTTATTIAKFSVTELTVSSTGLISITTSNPSTTGGHTI